jgi:hypothetical protein
MQFFADRIARPAGIDFGAFVIDIGAIKALDIGYFFIRPEAEGDCISKYLC